MTREEAIEVLRRTTEYFKKDKDFRFREAVETLVPEFNETEDERIRKHLIEVTELYWGTTNDPDKAKDMDWLERHKDPQTPGIEIGKSYKCIASPRFTCFRKGEVYVVEDEWMAKLFSVSEGCFEAVEHPKEHKFNVGDTIRLKNSYAEYTIESISGGRYYCKGCSIDIDGCDADYELVQKKPILEVFGFKVGDAVRLKDGDGRKHIIKSFEEVEGVHGPNFYHVEFEDTSARDGIYPGEEYPNGYYTQMEKFEEEQKPTATINGEPIPTENHSVDIPLAEWSEEDMDYYDTIVRKLEVIGDDSGLSSNQIKFLREHCPSRRSEWSEEDMTKLRDVRMIEDSGHVKSIREHYERFLNSLPERFNLQPKQEWSSEKPMDGLEEEMDKFFETMTVLEHENIFEDTFKNIARHFAQWQKSQMMKEAVEGEYDFYPAAVYLDVPIPRMNHGDKVRVIVIPNTDEK